MNKQTKHLLELIPQGGQLKTALFVWNQLKVIACRHFLPATLSDLTGIVDYASARGREGIGTQQVI